MNTIPQPAALNNPRIVNAWCMYDWANSVYSLVITSAIFPVYYKAVTTGANGSDLVSFLGFSIRNSVLYSYALSFAFLIVAAILPLMSGMADYTGNKKSFMRFFVWLGGLSCMGLTFFTGPDTLVLGIGFSILACIGYASSLVFYDAYLPEIVTEDRYDLTSAKGYSMGYYGSVLLMILCLILILKFEIFGFSNDGQATRFTFILVGIWWIGFSYIPLTRLPQSSQRSELKQIWKKGYQEVAKVWKSLGQHPDLKRYLIAFFFFNSGVQTVMYLATLFGTDVLHLADDKLILTILLIQLVASLGSWLFAKLSGSRGNIYSLSVMILIWIGVCFAAYLITTEIQFFALAFVVGIIMGGIQSLSRATYSKLLPVDTSDHTSYFSFYDVTYNLSIVAGTFAYGFIDQITGSMRNSALGLMTFFVVGMVMLRYVKSADVRKRRN